MVSISPEAGNESKQNPPKDRTNYKCWSCGEFGHLTNSKACLNKRKKQELEAALVNAAWQEYEAIREEQVKEYTVNNAVNVTQALLHTEILMDNQANISIVHPSLLENVRKASKSIRVKGVGGVQLVVDQVGTLNGFSQVYASNKMKANVLSFADVEDMYNITHRCQEAFIVHMVMQDIVFE